MSRMRRTRRESTSPIRYPNAFNGERLAIARGSRGLSIIGLFLVVFTCLYSVVRNRRSQAVDAAITLKMQGQKSRTFDKAMHIISWPGFPPQSRLIPPALSGLFWVLGFRLEAIFQLLAWGTGGISFVVKRSMRRPRPEATAAETLIKVAAANIGGSSFPSGHVLNYIGVYGFLGYLANSWIRAAGLRKPIVAAISALLALVGPSRVYLGHHWFTDVMASYMLGTSYLIALSNVYRWIRLRIDRRHG